MSTGAPSPRPPRGSTPIPRVPPWQPVSSRARLLIVLLALATALVLTWLMVQPKLQLMAAREARGEAPVPIGLPTEAHRAFAAASQRALPDRAACAADPASQVAGCVGGKMNVLVVPAAPSR